MKTIIKSILVYSQSSFLRFRHGRLLSTSSDQFDGLPKVDGAQTTEFTPPLNEKILVLGGNGFVGSHICREALVHGLIVSSLSRSGRSSLRDCWADNIVWHKGDLLSPDSIKHALDGVTSVISCVGGFGSNSHMYKINGSANVNAIKAATEQGVRRFVYISAADFGLVNYLLRGYYDGKRYTETELMNSFPEGGVILRPGFIHGTRASVIAVLMPYTEHHPETNPEEWGPTAWAHLSNLRNRSPLVQCITNFVSMDLMANTLLSAGASPAMVHSIEEIPDFTPNAHALCINVGTLSATWLPAMKVAAELATASGKPWVLDPVAAGASGFRLRACLDLVGLKPTVIRGNGSEIIALSEASVGLNKGVDSSHESMDAMEAAKSLAQASGAIVAVSGAVDIVTDGHRVVGAHNGVAMMQKITATGCAVTALIAAFVAVDLPHPLEATASALSIFGIAGELGMDEAKGPASLRIHLIDSLHRLDHAAVLSRVKITSL